MIAFLKSVPAFLIYIFTDVAPAPAPKPQEERLSREHWVGTARYHLTQAGNIVGWHFDDFRYEEMEKMRKEFLALAKEIDDMRAMRRQDGLRHLLADLRKDGITPEDVLAVLTPKPEPFQVTAPKKQIGHVHED